MNPWLPYVTNIKFKEKSTKVLYASMVHGKGLGFFYRVKGRVMHIAIHVKSTKSLPTHNVIYSIEQWYLKEMHDLSEVPFFAIGDRKTISSKVLSWCNGG